MLTYSQSSGTWTDATGVPVVFRCEAGNDSMGKDMNNPDSQCLHNRGPLPRGVYTIGTLAFQAAVRSQGCMLTPQPGNQMCGRSGFFLHLRNLQHLAPDGTNASSDGCITFASFGELAIIGNHVDRQVQVVT